MSDIRRAATVVIVRAGDRGEPEILMVRRAHTVAFMANACVFPGGRVEASDGDGEDGFLGAAVREVAEETSVVLETSALVPLAHWLTPSSEPRRYDTRFYLAQVPAGTGAVHDGVELVEHLWDSARNLLARGQMGELKLPPPTQHTLASLAPLTTYDAMVRFVRAREIVRVLPKIATFGEEMAIVLPWDVDYAALPGDSEPISPSHPFANPPSRFVLSDGRWWGRSPNPIPNTETT